MKLLHLTSLLAVALLAIPGGATARQPKFGDDGKFKIIQFTDAHVRADKPDELVVVDITIPAKLNAEEKRLVEQLAQQPDFQKAESVKNQNIFERMKSFFR